MGVAAEEEVVIVVVDVLEGVGVKVVLEVLVIGWREGLVQSEESYDHVLPCCA